MKFKPKYLTESQLDLACRYLNGLENPNFNIYAVGSMLRDVLGFDRAEAKEAFVYWIKSNESVKV